MFDIVVSQSNLVKSLGRIQCLVERKNTVPILGHILLEANNEGILTIIATDLEHAMVEKISANVTNPGTITLPMHVFYDLVKKFEGSDEIKISQEGNFAIIACKSASFKMPSFDSNEYPLMPRFQEDAKFSIKAQDLAKMINQTKFAMSFAEQKYALNGIYLHPFIEEGKKTLRFVASDIHRLAKLELPMPEGCENLNGFILSRKTVGELVKWIEDLTSDVEVKVARAHISFSAPNRELVARLVDASFPDYNSILVDTTGNVAIIDTNAFKTSLERVSILASESNKCVQLNLENNKVYLLAESQEYGSAKEEMAIEYEGASVTLFYNARYLMEVIQNISSAKVKFTFLRSSTPSKFENMDDPGSIFVVMPLTK